MRHERMVKVKRGQGKNQRIEELKTVVWGVEELVGLDSYGPADETAKKHRRNGRGRALNAVVVEAWDGKPGTPGEEVVFLTNLPVMDALRIFDLYDERSLIEVPLNKEAKQNWHLEHAPMRTRSRTAFDACRAGEMRIVVPKRTTRASPGALLCRNFSSALAELLSRSIRAGWPKRP